MFPERIFKWKCSSSKARTAKNEGFCAASRELWALQRSSIDCWENTRSQLKKNNKKTTWRTQRVCVASDPSRFPPLNKNTHTHTHNHTHTAASPPTCSGSAHKHYANHIPHSTLPLLSAGSEVNKMTASQGGRERVGGQWRVFYCNNVTVCQPPAVCVWWGREDHPSPAIRGSNRYYSVPLHWLTTGVFNRKMSLYKCNNIGITWRLETGKFLKYFELWLKAQLGISATNLFFSLC